MSFTITETPLSGAFAIEPRVFHDDRGYFFESYQMDRFRQAGITDVFVQDNEARSDTGVLRGLHYQVGPYAQSKLIRVIKGAIFDVIVDLRAESPTFGQWYGIELTAANKMQLYVPHGFAHGYLSLENDTIITYKCDNYYAPDHEGGLRYDDPVLGIAWPEAQGTPKLSPKDLALPFLGKHMIP